MGLPANRFPASGTRSGAGPSDAALVVSARADEAWAKEAIFRRHAALVNGLTFRLLGRDKEVDDVVQEVFAQAFATLDRLENPQALASWLSAITVRLVYKILRRRRLLGALGFRRSEPIDVEGIVSPNAPPEVLEELRLVYERIDRLPPDLRVALVLRRVEGLRLEAIATMTHASLATVKRRVAEADRRIREEDG